MKNGKLIRFDWAIKYLLRDKANFDILEGFLSAVLKRKVSVLELLESESNQAYERDKFNRVDLLVRVSYDELILVEVQVESELDFFHRIVYGTSKLIVENIEAGEAYGTIKKAISISIAYFNLGRGTDYLYHGTTNFTGVNDGDTLGLSPNQLNSFGWDEVRQIFPEHYIIRVEKFGDEVKSAIDEWIYMLKNSEVKPEFESRNIQVASKKLELMALDEKGQQAYKNFMADERHHNSMVWSTHEEGRQEGLREGLREGREEGREEGRGEGREDEKIEVIKNALQEGIPIETIAVITQLDVDDVRRIEQQLMQ